MISKQKKKKVFAGIRTLFLAEIANFNVFSAQKHPTSSSQENTVRGKKKNQGGKNENRGEIAPPAPCWRRACLGGTIFVWGAQALFLGVHPQNAPPPRGAGPKTK